MNRDNPFDILGNNVRPASLGEEISPANLPENVLERIQAILASSEIVLFMKGNSEAPQCGFSANTSFILNSLKKPFKTYNILSDPELRQALKDYSNWPTYPQLYVKGKLVGGNDIVTEMFESGDLQEMVGA